MTAKSFRLLMLALSILMLMSAFAGCSTASPSVAPSTSAPAGTPASTEAPTPSPAPVDKYAPIDGKEYTIQWCGFSVAPLAEEPEMAKYWGEKFGVKIECWNIDPSKWEDILGLRLATGEVPDVLAVRGTAKLEEYLKQDLLAAVPEDVYKTHTPTIYQIYLEEQEKLLKYARRGDVLYGYPEYSRDSKFRDPIVWNGLWLKNVGIEKTPETLAEFEDAFYKFVNNDPDQNGKKDTYALSNQGMASIYGAFGYLPWRWHVRDGKLVNAFVQPEMKDALTLLHKWYVDGVLDPEFVTGENKGGYWAITHAFVSGRIGYTGMGAYYHWWNTKSFQGENYIEMQKINPQAADSLVFGKPPVGPNGISGTVKGSDLTGVFTCYGKQLENEPDKLGKIMQIQDGMYSSKENWDTMTKGIKGKYWDTDPATGQFKSLGIYNDDSNEAYKQGTNSFFAVSWPYRYDLFPEGDKWCEDNFFTTGGVETQLLVALPSDQKYTGDLNTMAIEAFTNIITGKKPIEYFDEFVTTWKANGGDVLEKEANDWYSTIK